MTTLIATYGAIIATAGIIWQMYVWRRTHTTRLRVELANAMLTPSFDWHIKIAVSNLSEHPIRVTGAGFDLQDGSGRTVPIIQRTIADTLPGEVPSRDTREAFMLDGALQSVGVNLNKPLVGWVDTAAHGRIRSKPVTLREP